MDQREEGPGTALTRRSDHIRPMGIVENETKAANQDDVLGVEESGANAASAIRSRGDMKAVKGDDEQEEEEDIEDLSLEDSMAAEGDQEKEGQDESDHSSETDEEPAAAKGSSQTDEEAAEATTSEGVLAAAEDENHQLSQYELQRLERIKRNRQYLANLGLEASNTGPSIGQQPKKRRRRRDSVPLSQTRSSLSRRTKESVNYTEPPATLAHLIKKQQGDPAKKAGRRGRPPLERGEKKTKDINDRMDRKIYFEFCRIKAAKKHVLKQAKKDVRRAENEVKYWNKRVESWKRHEQRRLEIEKQNNELERERKDLGGTVKELMHDVDKRMPELLAAADQYDAMFEATAKSQEKELKRIEAENKIRLLDDLDRFPRDIKDAIALLNEVLLNRAPKDPPLPRRSTRAPANEGDPINATNKEKQRQITTTDCNSETINEDTTTSLRAQVDMADSQPPTKKRKRSARNVGGWISPDFSPDVQRSWLEKDCVDDPFNLSLYVPQAGDIVLYYPSAHRVFLERYPDTLGKKLKMSSRLPLWEKASRERDESGQSSTSAQSNRWWNDEWITGLESDTMDYPILCRVERCHAEFPPDPFNKVVKKSNEDENVKVYWKPPKDLKMLKSLEWVSLRLAVSLRPLAPLYPPVWKDGDLAETFALSVPPLFCVVMFPSDKPDPFLVPFGWAYKLAHSLSLNQAVIQIRDDSKQKIHSFSTFGMTGDRFRFQNKVAAVRDIVRRLDSGGSLQFLLQKESDSAPSKIPVRELRIVFETMKSFLADQATDVEQGENRRPIGLYDFIRCTLPLRNSISVSISRLALKNSSPWDLTPAVWRERLNPWFSNHERGGLDESLRIKIECVIEDFSKNNRAAEMFYTPVCEEEAPSYKCAVPVDMCFERIIRRLQPGRRKNQGCYYRSVESVLADISGILENCLLYNSPESAIVDAAVDVVTRLKEEVSSLSKLHFRDLEAALKATELRRQVVSRYCDMLTDDGEDDLLRDLPVVNTFKVPFKKTINRDWLQLPMLGSNTQPLTWAPQAGDCILYSRSKHASFVKGHYMSLDLHHCKIPRRKEQANSDSFDADEFGDSSVEDWVRGTVLSTRATFPRVLSRKSVDDTTTFKTDSLLLSIGLKLHDMDDRCVIVWRPCLLLLDGLEPSCENCSSCGLSTKTSFLQSDDETTSNGFECETLVRCFSFLKKRCMKGISPASVDSKLTKVNVKNGYKPLLHKVGSKNIPSFERFLYKAKPSGTQNGAVATRGVAIKSVVDCDLSSTEILSQTGVLPPWISASSINENILKKCESVTPLPSLTFELLLARARSCYYRHREALENDLVESYVSCVFMALAEPASRKKTPLSVKRLAKALSSGRSTEQSHVTPIGTVNEEEASWVGRLRSLRELYATAIVAVRETKRFETIFGLAPYSVSLAPKSTAPEPIRDPKRVTAREKLSSLLSAVGRDQARNTFGSNSPKDSFPMQKLKVICDGKLTSYRREVAIMGCAFAEQFGRTVKVKVICDGQLARLEKSTFDSISAENRGISRRIEKVVQEYVEFEQEDFEGNERLAKLFFARPGRTSQCARCQAHRRSFLSCRVRRAHSNTDFEWASAFRGVGGVTGLLTAVNPSDETPRKNDIPINGNSVTLDDDGGQGTQSTNNLKDDVENVDFKANGNPGVDPQLYLDMAAKARQLATSALRDAETFSMAPVRFAKSFVAKSFPVDESDGHYIYCVICGLSGNLLCCDGCANVFHNDCLALEDVPDGDWFCAECVADRQLQGTATDQERGSIEKEITAKKERAFGRVDFDLERLDTVNKMLQELRGYRPDRAKLNANGEEAQSDEGDEDVDSDNEEGKSDDEDDDVSTMSTASKDKLTKRSKNVHEDVINSAARRRAPSQTKAKEGERAVAPKGEAPNFDQQAKNRDKPIEHEGKRKPKQSDLSSWDDVQSTARSRGPPLRFGYDQGSQDDSPQPRTNAPMSRKRQSVNDVDDDDHPMEEESLPREVGRRKPRLASNEVVAPRQSPKDINSERTTKRQRRHEKTESHSSSSRLKQTLVEVTASPRRTSRRAQEVEPAVTQGRNVKGGAVPSSPSQRLGKTPSSIKQLTSRVEDLEEHPTERRSTRSKKPTTSKFLD